MYEFNNYDYKRLKYYIDPTTNKPIKDTAKSINDKISSISPERARKLITNEDVPTKKELEQLSSAFNFNINNLFYYIGKQKTDVKRILDSRKSNLFTQKEVADLSKIPLNTIKSLETSRMSLNIENAEKLAKVYNVESDYFFKHFEHGTKVLITLSHKGGCGKSSLSSNLAYELAQERGLRKPFKVLVIDADFQMNLTSSFGYGLTDESIEEMEELDKNIYKALTEKNGDIRNHIINTRYDNLDIVLGSSEMSAIEIDLYKSSLNPGFTMRKIMNPLLEDATYDIIIIDTHATLGITNVNMLNAADELIIPLEFSAFGIHGLKSLRDFYLEVNTDTNPGLQITGVVGNNVNKVRKVTKKSRDKVMEIYGDKVLNTSIGIDAKVQDSQYEGQPVTALHEDTRASIEYSLLADEILQIWDQDN